MVGDPVILVNRTTEPLPFVADGRHYVLEPGDNYGYVSGHVQFALAQNPLMGSEDYHTLDFQSLVGVKGSKEYPSDPIPEEVLIAAMDEVERFSRVDSGLAPVKRVRPRSAMPRGRAVASLANANALAMGN